MEWWLFLVGFIGILLVFIFIGLPVAFSFFAVNFIFITFVMGFSAGINQTVLSVYNSLAVFPLTTIPLFVLMGQLLLQSGIVIKALDAISKSLGRVPGRLSILSIVSGALFASLSGSSIANTSMLGTILAPEMRNRGYHNLLILGPIMASGSLAAVMPHSSLAILTGSVGKIAIGDLLIATIIPGFLLAFLFVVTIWTLCTYNPSLAPDHDIAPSSSFEKFNSFMTGVVPSAILILITVLLIFFGLATPTESAAIGAFGAIILVFAYRAFTWDVLFKSIEGTLKITSMILLIVAASSVFTQMLAFTGATRELFNLVLGFNVPPLMLVALMLMITIFLGGFIEPISIMMVTLPIFVPMVLGLGYDPVWFGLMMVMCLGLGDLTPPFGLLLFVMKGVSPSEVTMYDVYKSALPFVGIVIFVVTLILFIPELAIWLPNLSK